MYGNIFKKDFLGWIHLREILGAITFYPEIRSDLLDQDERNRFSKRTNVEELPGNMCALWPGAHANHPAGKPPCRTRLLFWIH